MKRICLAALLCSLTFGQITQTNRLFETASIKPSPPGTKAELIRRRHIIVDPARIDFAVVSLSEVIQKAYRLPGDQIVGPDWTTQQLFDIQATIPANSSKDDVPEMLQALLAERFRLVVHHDQKLMPVYAMVVEKDGPKFKESTAAGSGSGQCTGTLHKVCSGTTMQDLIDVLTLPYRVRMGAGWAIDHPVVDMTGLKGKYDFAFDYGSSGPATGAGSDSFGAFGAMKSLGLRLNPSKHAYDILVIDQIERTPTEN